MEPRESEGQMEVIRLGGRCRGRRWEPSVRTQGSELRPWRVASPSCTIATGLGLLCWFAGKAVQPGSCATEPEG